MAAVAAGEGCASVVGFGGGSPMDVAKLAAYLLATGEDLDTLWGVGKATGAQAAAGAGADHRRHRLGGDPVTVITVGGGREARRQQPGRCSPTGRCSTPS